MSIRSLLRAPLRLFTGNKPQVAVVQLHGAIGVDARPGRGLSANSVEAALKKAFRDKSAKAVVLSINSPGGAPAQSRMIMERARALSLESQVPIISYIEDVGASGGYLIALAGEEIIADPFAIVGSIGVVSAGFGFQDAIEKLGVERRVYTSGTNKVRLDPFRAEKPEDKQKLENLLAETHEIFIDLVKTSRGDRITGPADQVFSGDFFLASKGKEWGLIDEIGDLRQILKSRYGTDVVVNVISSNRGGLLSRLGASFSAGLVDAAASRLELEGLKARLGR